MHLQVYVDTNIFLNLLASQATVTDALNKFLALCENASIQLHLPQQTEQEFLSNREDVIARTITELRKASAIGALPRIVESHPSGDQAKALRRDLADSVRRVEQWYAEAARNHTLPIDDWFTKLRATSLRIPSTPMLIEKANQRAAAHLPPGKGDSVGDRIIWEALLDASSFCEDIHLITNDRKDYRSPLNPGEARKRLQEEWDDVNWGKVHIYDSVGDFLSSVSETDQFARATEIGRAIWSLGHQSQSEAIETACATIVRYIQQLSPLQACKIATNARAYYERVFITEEAFDTMLPDFWRLYAKHLDEKSGEALAPVLVAAGEIQQTVKQAANSN